jgi:transglutaminase-like putative cysteine protease
MEHPFTPLTTTVPHFPPLSTHNHPRCALQRRIRPVQWGYLEVGQPPRHAPYAAAPTPQRRRCPLATQVTAGIRTAFDATVALSRWFARPSNGFSYDLRTAPDNSGDALVDLLFTVRRGCCEQSVSAMAIMLRTRHVPARVTVGFTPGTVTDGFRLITTDDAHVWVEA